MTVLALSPSHPEGFSPDQPAPGFAVAVAEVHIHRGVVRVQLFGELDVLTAPLLRAALAPLFDSGPDPVEFPGRGTVHLDLSTLTFLDGTGLAALVENHTALTRAGLRVKIDGARDQVSRFLALAAAAGTLPEGLVWPAVAVRAPLQRAGRDFV